MKVGDFLELGRTPSILAKVENVPLFECQYGTHKGKYALRIDRTLRGVDMNWLGDTYVK
jgi:flagellar motor switch protein FliM